MAYTHFTTATPTTTQTRQAAIDSIRTNELALRDILISGYPMKWNITPGDSSNTATATWSATMADASQPGLMKYVTGTEEILLWFTWTNGYPTQIKFYYSPNNTSGYPANRIYVGYETITYDANLNVTGTTWTDTNVPG